jgi:hypothetical protein
VTELTTKFTGKHIHVMADLDSHLVEADPNSGWDRVVKDVTAGTCGGIGMYGVSR